MNKSLGHMLIEPSMDLRLLQPLELLSHESHIWVQTTKLTLNKCTSYNGNLYNAA